MNLYLYLIVARFAITWVRLQAGPALAQRRRTASD